MYNVIRGGSAIPGQSVIMTEQAPIPRPRKEEKMGKHQPFNEGRYSGSPNLQKQQCLSSLDFSLNCCTIY